MRREGTRGRVLLAAVALLAASGACVSLAASDAGTGASRKTVVANFEVGPPGWSQFNDLQYEEDRPLQESFGLVDTPVRSGARAARITVSHGYSRFGWNEATLLVDSSEEQPGDDYWYAFSVNFPSDWFPPDRWGIFAQWHANLGTSPVIAFEARADTATLNFHSGLTNEQANTFQYNISRPLLATLSKGKWNDFVMHVRWSTTNGEVEIWHKLSGDQRLRPLIRLAGMPTFQWTKSGEGIGIYALLGLYRGSFCSQPTLLGCTSPRGVQAPNTLYLDSYARATSFAAVTQAAFPNERTFLCSRGRGSVLKCPRWNRGME